MWSHDAWPLVKGTAFYSAGHVRVGGLAVPTSPCPATVNSAAVSIRLSCCLVSVPWGVYPGPGPRPHVALLYRTVCGVDAASEGLHPATRPPGTGGVCHGPRGEAQACVLPTCPMTGDSLLEGATVCSALLPPDKHVTSGHTVPKEKPMGLVVIKTREKKRCTEPLGLRIC